MKVTAALLTQDIGADIATRTGDDGHSAIQYRMFATSRSAVERDTRSMFY